MKRSMIAVVSVVMVCFGVCLLAGGALADVATYSDFSANVIRNGSSGTYTTSASKNDTDETFTITAVGGGKVAIGTSAVNDLTVDDFVNFKFSNSVTELTDSQIVYPNFWVTDGSGHYALVAMTYFSGQAQLDRPIYDEMISTGGMGETFFEALGVRVYGTDTSTLEWLYPGCVRMAKFGSWDSALWKSGDTETNNPVLISDIGGLNFGSPFTSDTVPGISSNPDWTYAGTGDPQMTDTWYLMCGDTSGSVENYNYTLGDFELEYVPEPATLSLLALGGAAALVRRKRSK